MQVVFGRNPEIPGDLLQDNPAAVARSAIMNDRGATQEARVRAACRMTVLQYSDKMMRAVLWMRARAL